MNPRLRKVVTGSSSVSSRSLPWSLVQHTKPFLPNTPVPSTTLMWKWGISTPINEGNLSPNELAVELLTAFSTGKIRMRGDVVEHKLSSDADESIADILSQLDSDTHHEDQNVNGPVPHICPDIIINSGTETKLIAGFQAKINPQTRVPYSEIHPEKIILGSPVYIPYKKISKDQKGKGSNGKKLKFPISSSSMMPR